MDFEKSKNPAEESKNEIRSEESQEKDAEKAFENDEEKNETADKEDEKMEDYVENHKDQIKNAAENWIKTQEGKLNKEGSDRIKKFAKIGAGVAASLEIALAGIASTVAPYNADELTFIGIGLIVAGAGGAIAGAMTGKFKNYFERKKFNKQKEKIEIGLGKKKTFESVKDSLDELK